MNVLFSPLSYLYKNKPDYIYLGLLLILVIVNCYYLQGSLLLAWDNGNTLYDPWRVFKGQVPNVDFVSGYPFLHYYIISSLYRMFGDSVEVAQLYLYFCSLILATSVYLLLIKYTTKSVSFLASYLATTYSVFVWWVSAPGVLVQAFTIILFLVLTKFYAFNNKSNLMLTAGIIIGLALSVKQTAVYLLVCLFYFLWWHLISQSNEKNRNLYLLLYTALNLLLMLAYYLLRIKYNYNVLNYTSLLPWLFTGFYLTYYSITNFTGRRAFRKISEPVKSEFLKINILAVFGLIIGITPFMIFIYMNDIDLISYLHEIYIRVPAFIDGYSPAVIPPGKRDILAVLLLLSVPFLRENKVYLFLFSFIISAISILSILEQYTGPYDNALFVYLMESARILIAPSHAFTITTFWFQIIPFVILIYLKFKNKINNSGMVLYIIASPLIAMSYPYPSTLYTAAIATILITVSLVDLTIPHDSRKIINANPFEKYFVIIIIGIFTLSSTLSGIKHRVGMANFMYISVKPFVRLSEYLKKLPEGVTIATFPNMALSLFLAKKLTDVRYGNFIGGAAEINEYVNEIKSKNIDYVIVNVLQDDRSKEIIYKLSDDYIFVQKVEMFSVYKRKKNM